MLEKETIDELGLSKEQVEIVEKVISDWADNLKQQGVKVIDINYEPKKDVSSYESNLKSQLTESQQIELENFLKNCDTEDKLLNEVYDKVLRAISTQIGEENKDQEREVEDLKKPLPDSEVSWGVSSEGEGSYIVKGKYPESLIKENISKGLEFPKQTSSEDLKYKPEFVYGDKKEGVKDFKGKLRWSLLPFEALKGTVRVLMYGAITKYSPDNWKKVKPQGVYLDAIFRHWIDYRNGEEFDDETGESHLSHLLCDILFLEYHRMNRDKNVSFEDYIREITIYEDYTKEVTQEEIDKRYGRN